jgi:glyoxylase-like metal-dependent hydrolase (beta-lactamase superfamily II)
VTSGEKLCAVIDPGGDAPQVAKAVEETGCTLRCILLTHGHFDHTGGVAGLVERFPGTPVYLSPLDIYPPEKSPHPPSLPAGRRGNRALRRGRHRGSGRLDLCGAGHSRPTPEGSVTLKCGDALFCGDTLFASSCGRTDLAGGNTDKMVASLRRLGQLEGDYKVCPGHMNATTLDAERASNPTLKSALWS